MNENVQNHSGQYGDVSFQQWLQRGNLTFDEVWKNNSLHAHLGRQYQEYQGEVKRLAGEYNLQPNEINIPMHSFHSPDPHYRRLEERKKREAFERSSYRR